MRTCKIEFWWSLKECHDAITSPSYPINADVDFYNLIYAIEPASKLIKSIGVLQPYINDVLNITFRRYYSHYVGTTDIDILTIDEAKNMLSSMMNILIMTYPKYAELLKIYDDAKTHLMDGVITTTTGLSRFNDTPQESEVSEEFEDEEHTTTLNKSKATTENDYTTKMARIQEIQNSYRSMLMQWSNEFDKIFIEEDNI